MPSDQQVSISVFMPVYNGAQYLHKSIESVLNQTFTNFELVCVDDSSSDNSYAILEGYAKKDKRLLIFRKPNGGNVPKSWNFVMPFLKGKFISYMSQDDWMSKDNLELSYERHLNTKANIIIPDLIDYSKNGKIKTIIGVKGDRSRILSGREAFLLSLNWEIHGFCLCESKLMKSELFDESSFNSDEYVTRKNFLLSDKVAFSNGIFNHNNDNPNAITKKFELHTLTALLTDQRLIELIENNNFNGKSLKLYILKSFVRMAYFYYRWKRISWKDSQKNDYAKVILKQHFVFIKKHILLSFQKSI